MLRPRQSRRRLITASCSVLIIRGADCFLMFKNSVSLNRFLEIVWKWRVQQNGSALQDAGSVQGQCGCRQPVLHLLLRRFRWHESAQGEVPESVRSGRHSLEKGRCRRLRPAEPAKYQCQKHSFPDREVRCRKQ